MPGPYSLRGRRGRRPSGSHNQVLQRRGTGAKPDGVFWLEDVGPIQARPPLPGPASCDVAILGAGYTGLWTALELLKRDAGLDVVVLERDFAGFGASGRNGSWVSPHVNIGLEGAIRRFGRDAAVALQRAMLDTVDEVDQAATEEGIDAGYAKTGYLLVARGEEQRPPVEAAARAYEEAGFGDLYHLLDADEIAERVRITRTVAALHCSQAATIHPARLVRGLAAAVERRGGRIYEQTAVTAVVPGPDPRLTTDHGDVHANIVVLAGEAYLSQLGLLSRRLVPVYSLVVLTEPLPEAVWAEIGWEGRELVASRRLSVEYLARTEDGRILFGGRGAPYRLGSRITVEAENDEATHESLRAAAREWFPALREREFTHAWGGVLGVPRAGCPTVSFSRTSGLAVAGGYTGSGVATANLAGRILADRITDRPTDITRLPIVGERLRPWPPEPLRWLGIRSVARAYESLDRIGERFGRPPPGRDLAERILRG